MPALPGTPGLARAGQPPAGQPPAGRPPGGESRGQPPASQARAKPRAGPGRACVPLSPAEAAPPQTGLCRSAVLPLDILSPAGTGAVEGRQVDGLVAGGGPQSP